MVFDLYLSFRYTVNASDNRTGSYEHDILNLSVTNIAY